MTSETHTQADLGVEASRLRSDTARRLLPGAVWMFLIWPGSTVLAAAWMLGEQPLISSVAWTVRVTGATGSVAYLFPELLATGLVLLVLNLLFWATVTIGAKGRTEALEVWTEPPLFLLALSIGVVAIYPAQLRHPIIFFLRSLPVAVAVLLLVSLLAIVAAVLGYVRTRTKRGTAVVASSIIVAIVASSVLTAIPTRVTDEGIRGSILLLGLDSLAQTQDLPFLESMAEDPSWTWYEHPVTPGLLTNSVWPAILMNRPVHETGCYLTFQDPVWERSPYNMVEAAEESGFETWSFFSDQFTTYVGTNGGFDVNRSGPKGWLQPGTAAIKDASILLPVMLPRLPTIPWAKSPRNQSGTFAYDLRRELEEIATAGDEGQPVFVAAHLDYLHQPAYPGLHELSSQNIRAVLRAPVKYIRDLSIHWQYPDLEGEPIGLYQWKLRRLQRLVVEVLEQYELAEPGRRNRIAIFSDHGPRTGIQAGAFSQRHLYKVPLVTTGTAPRDPAVPISLLDINKLIGLPDPTRPEPAPAAVEYTFMRTLQEEVVVMRASSMRSDGQIELNPWIIARFGEQLLAYFPHQAERGYVPVPTLPAEFDRLVDDPSSIR